MKKKRLWNLGNRGAETIEMALVLPLFVTLLFSGFEYGWAVLKIIQLDHVASIGARVAALSGSTSAEVENTVNSALSDIGITGSTITLNPQDPANAVFGTPIVVKIETPYSEVQLLGLSGFMPLPASLTGRASMVKEPDP
jgi:Flp pilus assembly protein TadG